jgi:transglutaminase-like putative cysteine protease
MPRSPSPPARTLAWTCGALAAGVVLHLGIEPAWVTAAALALVLLRLAAAARLVPSPSGGVRLGIGSALVAAVFAEYHTLNGLEPGTALLTLMVGIKLLETRSRRDEYFVLGGALFLLLAACLERQQLERVPLYLLEALLCCAALAVVAHAPEGAGVAAEGAGGGDLPAREAFALAGRSLLYASPLAVLLFLFFPRLPGALWALPASGAATTGLGNTLSPGRITSLTDSYAVAFRVRFDGAPPPGEDLYWRGPVLHDFDGATWRRGRSVPSAAGRLECLSKPYRYRVYLAPTFRRWWIALDTVMSAPGPNVREAYDYELIARHPVTRSISYRATSCAQPLSPAPLTARERREDTALPAGSNPRTRALAHRLRRHARSDADFVRAALEFLRTGGFRYTLRPPPLGANPVDEFLFDTRAGFCGHYASAFVDLMRAGGVPARVVTGYLGGQWNPYDGELIVRQSDAHAWAEVWLAGRGWTRVDPTAVVEPARLTHGILDLLPDAVSVRARLIHASPLLTRTLERWEALNAWWNQRVVGFDSRSQLALLEELGVRSPRLRDVGWAFAAALLGWLGWISWQLGRDPRPPPPDPLARGYRRLCRKLARIGLPRAEHMGPREYLEVIARERPDLVPQLAPLLTRYMELRYGPQSRRPPPAQTRRFERRVARLALTRRARASPGRRSSASARG